MIQLLALTIFSQYEGLLWYLLVKKILVTELGINVTCVYMTCQLFQMEYSRACFNWELMFRLLM